MRNAFSLQGPHGELTEADHELLDRLAGAIETQKDLGHTDTRALAQELRTIVADITAQFHKD